MKKKDIPETCCVSLIYAYKVAMDKEKYLLCKSIQEELVRRKHSGELSNDLIEATWKAYELNAQEYRGLHYEVFLDMLQQLKGLPEILIPGHA